MLPVTKKFLALLLALLVAVSAVACTGSNAPDTSAPVSSTPAPESTDPSVSTNPPDTTAGTDTPDITEPTTDTDVPDITEPTTGTDVPDITEPVKPTDPKPTEPKPTEPAKPEGFLFLSVSNTDSADVTWSGKNVTFSDADAAGYVTATVSGSYKVGDTLKTSAFTVKVTMSDGTVKTNPSGWSASPLKLSSTSN